MVASKRQGSRNRVMGDRLGDDSGVEWNRTTTELPRDRIAELLRRADVRMATHQSMTLRWVDDNRKDVVWRSEIEPNLHDRPDYRPPDGAPGQKPFVGTLWRAGDRELLVFDDFD